MDTYTIHPVVMGTKVFDRTMMTYQHGFGETMTIPIYAWIVRGKETVILIDTGEMHPIQSDEREKAIGGKIYTFEEGLKKWGLTPKDINIVIHTHLHNDHCENDYQCENATFYIHEKELEAIHHPHPLDYRYIEDYILEIEENNQIESLSEDREIIPGIWVIHTPAHTSGGLSVKINTMKGMCIITGFCTIDENFNPPLKIKAMELDVIPPGTHVNSYEAYDILIKVKKMADILIPLHEPKFASVDTIGE